MSTNYNVVILVGKLVLTPKLKHDKKDATSFAIFDLAVCATPKSKELLVEVAVYKHQAELCCRFLAKGSEILVSGELEEFIGEIGDVKCSKLRIKADRVQFLDRKAVRPS